MTNGPTWYEILGVDPSASPEEIKAAWRSATDKFEPGSGQSQFRLFNEAADVLLDPARRKEYDDRAGLRGTAEPGVEESAKPRREPEPATAPKAKVESPGEATPAALPEETAKRRSVVIPLLAALAVMALVVAVVFGIRLKEQGDRADVGYFQSITDGDAPARADAAASASAAAERALTAALSYDYRRMEADKERAVGFMTKAYGKEFANTFDKLLTAARQGQPNNVVKTRTVVQASVLNVGAMNPAEATTGRVRVLAFVNQVATKGQRSPTVFRNRVAATMVKRDGAWLIDGLDSY